MLHNPAVDVRRHMYDRVGLFDLDYKISANYDQRLRLLRQQETTVRYIPETLIQMRLEGASNQSLQSILLKSSEDYRIIQRHKLIGFLTLLGKNLSKVRQFRPF